MLSPLEPDSLVCSGTSYSSLARISCGFSPHNELHVWCPLYSFRTLADITMQGSLSVEREMHVGAKCQDDWKETRAFTIHVRNCPINRIRGILHTELANCWADLGSLWTPASPGRAILRCIAQERNDRSLEECSPDKPADFRRIYGMFAFVGARTAP